MGGHKKFATMHSNEICVRNVKRNMRTEKDSSAEYGMQ